MSDVLARICEEKRAHIARRRAERPLSALASDIAAQSPPRRFAARLAGAAVTREYGLIAEIKKASPSQGVIRADFDPAALARAYEDGGATCLSVLTDTPFFQGEDEYLGAAREAVELPVLRKDFMLDPYQVAEARAIGADCILIIMAALDDGAARELADAAKDYAMDALVEVHDEDELERALKLDCRLIGINNRDLKTLETDLAVTERLAPLVPAEKVLVAESGIETPDDLARLARAGAWCSLVGTSLMAADDVAAATQALLASAQTADAQA